MVDDNHILAWKRLRDFEYRTEFNFFRDLFYNDQWVEVHKDSDGIEDGASLTTPIGKTFVFVAAVVQNAAGGNKDIEFRINGIELENLDLGVSEGRQVVLPIQMVPAGQITLITNTSGNGAWHSSIYGYFELETKTSFNTFIDSS